MGGGCFITLILVNSGNLPVETSSINEGHDSLLALKAKQVAPLVAFVEVFELVRGICRPASGQRFRKCLLFYICIFLFLINALCQLLPF